MSETPKTRLVREDAAWGDAGAPLCEDEHGHAWFATRWPDDPDCPIKAEDALRTFVNGTGDEVRIISPPQDRGNLWSVAVEYVHADVCYFCDCSALTLLPEPEREERCKLAIAMPTFERPRYMPCVLSKGHEGECSADRRTHQRRKDQRRQANRRSCGKHGGLRLWDNATAKVGDFDRRTGKDRRSNG